MTKAATATEAGIKVYTCKRCGGTRMEIVPAAVPAKNGKGSAKETERIILLVKSNRDVSGSSFSGIRARALKMTESGITVQWNRVSGANRYVVYGAKCRIGSRYRKLKTTSGTSYRQTKLRKGTYYKYMVVAIDPDGRTKAVSKVVYAVTSGGKYGNYKAVKVSKPKITLKKGKSVKLKAAGVKADKKRKVRICRKIAFESANPKIVTVSSSGTVRAKAKGRTTIYCYAQNGVYRAVQAKAE